MTEAILANGLGKCYWVSGLPRQPYQTLRQALIDGVRSHLRSRLRSHRQAVWALRDASFAIPHGRAVGIIGRNGAGKSTLLRILARITKPTTGEAVIRGRVGSLLEVGTGFHPELTGRDNIFLSGALLGMKRREITRRFDEIVAFAEVERFVDTPVKRYSSGMYTRLAFSVAAHLEPEILLVDEVLAVGDVAFQRKCLGRMRDVTGEGRTVLFVSHNMAAVQALCPASMLLDHGGIAFHGDTRECVRRYLEDATAGEQIEVELATRRRPQQHDPGLRIERVHFMAESQRPVIGEAEPIQLALEFVVSQPIGEVILGMVVSSIENVRIFECRSSHDYGPLHQLAPGRYTARCTVSGHNLAAGHYQIGIGARSGTRSLDWLPDAIGFQVFCHETGESSKLDDSDGLLRIASAWTQPTPVVEATIKTGA